MLKNTVYPIESPSVWFIDVLIDVVAVQSLSHLQLFASPWSMPGLPVLHYLLESAQIMSIESMMLSNHVILCHSLLICLQSFPASGSFQMSQLFSSGGQSIGDSVSASVLPMNIQDWFTLVLTSLISLHSKRLSRVFSNTTVQKHQFFGAQSSLWSNSHISLWPLEKS